MNWLWCSAVSVAISVSLTQVARADTPGYPEQVLQWTVAAGESCEDVAKAVYGSTKHKNLVLRYNRVTCVAGAPLREGMTLVLPATTKEAAPAKLTSVKQDTVTKPSGGPWAEAAAGQALPTNASVNTREGGRAGIVFNDQSKIFLSEHTLVVIFATADQSTVGASHALPTVQLSEGELQAGIAALRGGSARVGLEGGASVAAASTDVVVKRRAGATNVSVFDGKASVTSARTVVEVPANFGTKFATGKPPAPPRPLPAAPTWETAPKDIVWGGATGTLSVSWRPVEKTAAYRVQVARDAAFEDLVVSEQVGPDIVSFRAEGLPPGEYQVRVRVIDTEDFLGLASSRQFIVAGLELHGGAKLEDRVVQGHPYGGLSLTPNAALEISADGATWQPYRGKVSLQSLEDATLQVRLRGNQSSAASLSLMASKLPLEDARGPGSATLKLSPTSGVRLDGEVGLIARDAETNVRIPVTFAEDGLTATAPASDGVTVAWLDGGGLELARTEATPRAPAAPIEGPRQPISSTTWADPTLTTLGLGSTDSFFLVQPRPRSVAFVSFAAAGVDSEPRARVLTGARGAFGPMAVEGFVSSPELVSDRAIPALDETAWLGLGAHLGGTEDHALDVGANLRVAIPMSEDAPAPRLEPMLALGGTLDAFSWVVDVGARVRMEDDARRASTDALQGIILTSAAFAPHELISLFGGVDARISAPEPSDPIELRGGASLGLEVGTWLFGSATVRATPWADDVGFLSGAVALGVREPARTTP